MRRFTFIVICLLASVANAAPIIKNNAVYYPKNSDYAVFVGKISLASEGYWKIVDSPNREEAVQLYLVPAENESHLFLGRRMGNIEKKRQVQKGLYTFYNLYRVCKEYAKNHGHVGPLSLSDLDSQKNRYLLEKISRSPWGNNTKVKFDGPYIFLLPEVKFDLEWDKQKGTAKNRQVLAVELHPYVDDGKHWVIYTDGSANRDDIDRTLTRKYNLDISPVLKIGNDSTGKLLDELSYKIIAIRNRDKNGPLAVTLENLFTDKNLTVHWDLSDAKPDEKTVSAELNRARLITWTQYTQSVESPVLQTWLASSYGNQIGRITPSQRGRNRNLSVYGFLGGRAAVQETLQLQVLNMPEKQDHDRTIPVSTIEGVMVKSHPYEEMLKNNNGGGLALANVVPHDHLFVYLNKPSAIMPFLDDGADFLSHFGATITSRSIEYDLKSKYLSRLGLNNQWLKKFIESGAITESAFIFPDVFFIDGTDVTVVSRIVRSRRNKTLLKLAGIKDLSKQSIVTHDTEDGQSSYWALRGDLLFISTNKSELNKVLQLQKNSGKGSLGKSAEFRYMLTQLPLEKQTRVYAYFSDPFIRNLVGPSTKIAQARRMIARADMEFLTSCALLAELDGIKNPASLETLVNLGYLPERYLSGEYSIDRDLVVHSGTYGTLPHLKTLQETPVGNVTSLEERSYKRYIENYNSYWRRFFDPIGIRINDAPGRSLEATTFILPLIDNSIYNTLRESLLRREDAVKMKIPEISSEPVLMLSFNLRDSAWERVAEMGHKLFTRYTRISTAALDDLGPSFHLAIQDSDPVIALGSGDIFGAFNANPRGIGRNTLMIPTLLSILTRPCTLIIETQDPEKTRQYLRQASSPAMQARNLTNELNVNFYQIQGRDEWVYTFDIMGTIKLRYGLEIQDNFLLIRNIPWSNKDKIASVDWAPLNGAQLQVFPGACNLQLAGLYASASDRLRSTALQGMSYLYPLIISGYATMDNAAEKHAKLFGFMPVHPGEGHWIWKDYQLTSSQYGSVYREKQPGYNDGDSNFGLLKKIQHLSVNMQFEDTGLRTKVRWKLR